MYAQATVRIIIWIAEDEDALNDEDAEVRFCLNRDYNDNGLDIAAEEVAAIMERALRNFSELQAAQASEQAAQEAERDNADKP